jgi:transketolase
LAHAPDHDLATAACAIRALTADAVRAAGIGHVGLPLGCAELGALLFAEVLKHDPAAPTWPDRDRFVLSAGHGSMLLYSLLHLSGYAVTQDDLRRFRQLGSITPGHPEHGVTPGVETTTGPLGQGIANAVGMALAERMLAARLGGALVDHRTYVIASDGDLMEGVASEAASLAGHLGLGRLIVFYDDNHITIDGPTSLAFSENVPARFLAYGWDVQCVDGHDFAALRRAIAAARSSEDRPHLIACRTEIGRGCSVSGDKRAHGAPGGDVLAEVRERLPWKLPEFEVPDAAREVFRANAARSADARRAWATHHDAACADAELRDLCAALYDRALPDALETRLPRFDPKKALATRAASGAVIHALADAVPALVGGSADLAGSNNTEQSGKPWVERGKFGGRNLAFGVREHGMAAIASGMALHGGLRPYVATFLVFSDYMRPAVRLAALMRQPVTYIFTHDSIFVGEDGPTHQPVEQIAALRAIPGLDVWRPADASETAQAWLAALRRHDGPTALILTRQSLPQLAGVAPEGVARGGYVIAPEPEGTALELVIAATGSEVQHAVSAARSLAAEGRGVRAVSLPCLERFAAQDPEYRRAVLPDGIRRLVIEAGVRQGVAGLLAPGDAHHGMDRFGESAPADVLAEHFGFTHDAVLRHARALLG